MKERTRFAFAMIERSEFFCLATCACSAGSICRSTMGAWLSKQQASPAPASSPPPCWSGLPPELADIVLRRLPSLADRARFASACRHWRHVATQYSPSPPDLPPALPWLNFHDGSFRSLPDGEPHSFPLDEDTLCGGSSGCGGWVLLRRPWSSRTSHRHFLKNPLLGTTRWLPGHCREPVDLNPDGSRRPVSTSTSTSTRFLISKVIVCSGDLIAATVNYHITGPCAVVCCRPGMSSWSAGLRDGRRYKDMAASSRTRSPRTPAMARASRGFPGSSR